MIPLSDGSSRPFLRSEYTYPVRVSLPADVTDEEWEDLKLLPRLDAVAFKKGAERSSLLVLAQQPWFNEISLDLCEFDAKDLDLVTAFNNSFEENHKKSPWTYLFIKFKKFTPPLHPLPWRFIKTRFAIEKYQNCLDFDFSGFSKLQFMDLSLPDEPAPSSFIFRAPKDLLELHLRGAGLNLSKPGLNGPQLFFQNYYFESSIRVISILGYHLSLGGDPVASVRNLDTYSCSFSLNEAATKFPNLESVRFDLGGVSDDLHGFLANEEHLMNVLICSQEEIPRQVVEDWYKIRKFKKFVFTSEYNPDSNKRTYFQDGFWDEEYKRK